MKANPRDCLARRGAWRYCVAGLLGLVALGAGAAERNVHLYGALVAEPCVIAPGDEQIAVDFGTVIDKYLYLNTRTMGQPFEIHLEGCDLSLGQTVTVTFLGTENGALPGLLALDGGSQAAGIGIGLETDEAKPVRLNTASSKLALQSGYTVLALKAYVQGEPTALSQRRIVRGPFSATATFSLAYE